MTRAERFAAFRVPAFRRFFLAQTVYQTGMWFQSLTVAIVLAERTASATALSGVAIATFGPTLLFSSIAGRVCDRWSPRRVAIGAAIAQAVTGPALVLVFAAEQLSLPLVYAALAIGGSASTFTRVASQSLVYELVGPDLLQNASIWASLINSTARVAGPVLSGASYALAGATTSLILNAAVAITAAITMASIRESLLHSRRRTSESGAPVAEKLPRATTVVLVMNAVVCFGTMNMVLLLTSLIALDFSGDATALGLTHALNAVGGVSAAVIITRLRRITPKVAVACVAIFGLTQFAVAAPPILTIAVLLNVVLGVGISLFQSTVATAVQTSSPPAVLGRAMGLVNLGTFGPMAPGAIVLGALIDATSGRFALALCGLWCLLTAAVVILVLRSRWVREEPGSARADVV